MATIGAFVSLIATVQFFVLIYAALTTSSCFQRRNP